jgi:hypothetical protein
MTAHSYERKETGSQSLGRPPEQSPDMEQIKQKLLDSAGRTYEEFQEAYAWNRDVANELFDRVMGSKVPISDALTEQLKNLWVESFGSSFLADEKRVVNKCVFDMFAHKLMTQNEILQTCLSEFPNHHVSTTIDVANNLLLTLQKLSAQRA